MGGSNAKSGMSGNRAMHTFWRGRHLCAAPGSVTDPAPAKCWVPAWRTVRNRHHRRVRGQQWFSASMRLVILVEGEGATSQDEVVHVFRADDCDAAFQRALALGRSHERDYKNGYGQQVRWRLDRILTLDMIRVPDLDGAEVFSALSDVSGGPGFDADFHPERQQPAQTGI
jgi:Domain of unknown function (DUF4288)